MSASPNSLPIVRPVLVLAGAIACVGPQGGSRDHLLIRSSAGDIAGIGSGVDTLKG